MVPSGPVIDPVTTPVELMDRFPVHDVEGDRVAVTVKSVELLEVSAQT